MSGFWAGRRVMVTGGARLPRVGASSRGCEAGGRDRDLRPAQSRDYDLRTRDGIDRALADGRPDLVIHLAAVVGGIGANRENPGRFFYDNAIMGIQLMEQARLAGVAKFVADRHRLRLPQVHAGAVPRGRPLERLPGGDERALRPGQEDAAGPGPGLPRSSTASTRSTCCRSTSTARATTSIRRSSHVIPALIKKCVDARERGDGHIEVWGTGSASREFLYVDDAAEGIVLAAERYDGAEPVNLGVGREITIRDLVGLIARLTGFAGEIRWDPIEAGRPAAPSPGHESRPRALRLRGHDKLRRWLAEHDRLVRGKQGRAPRSSGAR